MLRHHSRPLASLTSPLRGADLVRGSTPFSVLTFLIACLAFLSPADAAIQYGLERLTPDDPRFHYDGRVDDRDRKAPVIIWQGTEIRIDFEGNQLAFLFTDTHGQVFFDLAIDGQTAVIEARDGRVPCPFPLTDSPHSLTLFKRSEASAGTTVFKGLQVNNSENATKPDAPTHEMKLLFFGDSITAGACNEDPGDDQWDDRSTHNNALSYGALTAKALDAQYRNIAVSGMGISVGYTEPTFPEIWNRLYPRPDAPLANTDYYQPDYLFINLGENDDSFSKNHGNGFPADYADRYIAMVRDMRLAYPEACIVILRGGMYGGAQSERLRPHWQKVVNTLEASDPDLTHFVFTHWSGPHPRVADHQKLAEELAAFLQTDQSHR